MSKRYVSTSNLKAQIWATDTSTDNDIIKFVVSDFVDICRHSIKIRVLIRLDIKVVKL